MAFLVRQRHPGLRVVSLGGSMGACVGLNAAERRPELFDLCVYFCPAVSFEKLKALKSNKILLPLLGILSRLARSGVDEPEQRRRAVRPASQSSDAARFVRRRAARAVSAPLDAPRAAPPQVPWLPLGEKSVEDLEREAELAAVGPPIFHTGKLRTRYAEHGLLFGERAVARAGRIAQPLLLLHARDDEFADFRGAELLMAAAASTDKTLVDDLDGMGHGLCANDAKSGGKFIRLMIAWIEARLLGFELVAGV